MLNIFSKIRKLKKDVENLKKDVENLKNKIDNSLENEFELGREKDERIILKTSEQAVRESICPECECIEEKFTVKKGEYIPIFGTFEKDWIFYDCSICKCKWKVRGI